MVKLVDIHPPLGVECLHSVGTKKRDGVGPNCGLEFEMLTKNWDGEETSVGRYSNSTEIRFVSSKRQVFFLLQRTILFCMYFIENTLVLSFT